MSTQRGLRLSLAGALALALCGAACMAVAQPASPPATPMAAPPPASSQFEQGTESSATYPLADSHGGTLTVRAGMPAQAHQYGPPPPFKTLDANHDGRISQTEAQAYPPLDNDFLSASHGGKTVSRAQYAQWAKSPR